MPQFPTAGRTRLCDDLTVDLIDDVETIEKSKRVQRDQQAGYRELFRHPQIWERQAAIACPGRSVCFIPSHSIPAGAHKRTKNHRLAPYGIYLIRATR
jgi:hypothetical protein